MGFPRFIVRFASGEEIELLFAQQAKETAKKEVAEGRQAWAEVYDRDGTLIRRFEPRRRSDRAPAAQPS